MNLHSAFYVKKKIKSVRSWRQTVYFVLGILLLLVS